MAAQVFWTVFYSSRQPSPIGPTADFEGAAIPPLYFHEPYHQGTSGRYAHSDLSRFAVHRLTN